LSVLAALHKEAFDGFEIFGIVKETGVGDEGLVQFYEQYFQFPLYCDKTYSMYRALGDRKVGLKDIWNPLSIIGILCDAFQRMHDKSIDGDMLGEGIVQGGYIIFGRDGKARCMYQEHTGVDLPVADLVEALSVVRK
jgi:hypothetical protein